MTSHVARLYAAAGTLLAFFLAWAGIAAHPWSTSGTKSSGQAQAVAVLQQRIQRDAALLRQLSARPGAVPARSVRVVQLPPVTTTRTS
jgi:hypothetical protein